MKGDGDSKFIAVFELGDASYVLVETSADNMYNVFTLLPSEEKQNRELRFAKPFVRCFKVLKRAQTTKSLTPKTAEVNGRDIVYPRFVPKARGLKSHFVAIGGEKVVSVKTEGRKKRTLEESLSTDDVSHHKVKVESSPSSHKHKNAQQSNSKRVKAKKSKKHKRKKRRIK